MDRVHVPCWGPDGVFDMFPSPVLGHDAVVENCLQPVEFCVAFVAIETGDIIKERFAFTSPPLPILTAVVAELGTAPAFL